MRRRFDRTSNEFRHPCFSTAAGWKDTQIDVIRRAVFLQREVCALIIALVVVGGSNRAAAEIEALSPRAPHVFVQGDDVKFALTPPAALPETGGATVQLWALDHRDRTSTLTDVLKVPAAPLREGNKWTVPAARPLELGWFEVTALWTAPPPGGRVLKEAIRVAHVPRQAVPADPIGYPWGVGAYWAMRFGRVQAKQAADQMKAAGLVWNREELLWDIVEPEQGRWTWEKTDMAIETAHAGGIGVLGLLDYWGRWCPAARLGDLPEAERLARRDEIMAASIPLFAEYCRRVVLRYKPGGEFARLKGWGDGWGVRHWEVWNEPATFWGGTPEMFGRLLRAAGAAIREADPESEVFFANAGQDFDARVIAVAGMESFDSVCPHYYCPPRSPEEGGLDRGMSQTRAFFEERGFKGHYWISESGWYSRGVLAGMARQGAFLARMGVMARAEGMDKFLWYNYRNDGPEASTDTEHQFGLVFREDLSPKPAYAAYAALAATLGPARFVRRIQLHPDVRVYVFDRTDRWVIAAWSTAQDGALRVNLPFDELCDMMGNRIGGGPAINPPGTKGQGAGVIPLTAEPHYLLIPRAALPGEAVIAALERGELVHFAPLEIEVRPLSGLLTRGCPVTAAVHNFGKEALRGSLKLEPPPGWLAESAQSPLRAWPPGVTEFTFTPRSQQRNRENRYPMRVALIGENGAEIAATGATLVEFAVARGTATVDGDLSEWSGDELRWFHLDSPDQAVGLEPYMTWNLSADFALRWSEQGLYFAGRVTDNAFVQPHVGTLVWQGDNWQLGFGYPADAFSDETSPRSETAAQYSYGLSLTREGPQVWCWFGQGRAETLQKDIPLAVRRVDEHTTEYEALIPAAALAPIPMKSGTAFRFCALLNDNDGGGRRGWLELSPGIGTGFNPAQYHVFMLE
ncbi:MAG: hypothetical protein Kow0059_18840 [Candidatus Sumerlaeia bacterium]